MTLDERIEVFFESTESLHASTQELHAGIQELRDFAQEHTKQLEIDAENIRRLANIAGAHEQRISWLEGAPE